MNDDIVRVLRHIAEHCASPGVHRLNTPFDVPGLSFEERVAGVRRLTEVAARKIKRSSAPEWHKAPGRERRPWPMAAHQRPQPFAQLRIRVDPVLPSTD